jgi:hypothetical protein
VLSAASRACWARATLLVWPQRYRVASLSPALLPEAAALLGRAAPGTFAALVLERDEVSLTLEETRWTACSLRGRARAEAGPFRVITFDLDLDLALVGFLAPAAERLARAGVSIIPQCAYAKDHLLVREADLEATVATLRALIEEARS